jgi:hypothetical protein
MSSSIPLATGLEQGVLALLGSNSSQALLQVIPHSELALACLALFVILRETPPRLALFGRVSVAMAQVISTIALNTILEAAAVDGDPAMTVLNLMSIYIMAIRMLRDGILPETAQYLVVLNISKTLEGFNSTGLAVAWSFAIVPRTFLWDWGDLTDLAQLVTVETWSTWFRSSLPSTLLLPSTLVVLYLSAPFIKEFPLLQRLFRFAVFAISKDRQLQQVPPWLLASGLWGIWQLETDAVAKSLAATAGTNAAVLALLDAMRFAMSNDPAPTLLALLVTIRIYEDVTQETKKPPMPTG